MPFFVWVVSDFLFSVTNRKQKISQNFKSDQKMLTNTRKSAKKHPESHLGLVSVDLTLSEEKIGRFFPGSACRRNFVAADFAPNRDALPQPNTFTWLELSVNLVLIEGLTGPSKSSLSRLTEKPRSKLHVARKLLDMAEQGGQRWKGVTQLEALEVTR